MDWNAYDQRTSKLLKLAASSKMLSRKDLGKQYDKALKEFQKIKAKFDEATSKQKEAQNIVESLQGRMDELKDSLLDIGSKMRDADLVGAHTVKERKEGPTFMIGKDEYVLDKDEDNNPVTVLLKDWKKQKAEREKENMNPQTDPLEKGDADDSANAIDGPEFSSDVSLNEDADLNFLNDITNIETKFR